MDIEYPCPACGFFMFHEPPGSFDICSLCGWEDDHVQLAHPRLQGGANGYSLMEAQLKALKNYPLEVQQTGEFKRDPLWHPVDEKQAQIRDDFPGDGHAYFEAACVEEPAYYWRAENGV